MCLWPWCTPWMSFPHLFPWHLYFIQLSVVLWRGAALLRAQSSQKEGAVPQNLSVDSRAGYFTLGGSEVWSLQCWCAWGNGGCCIPIPGFPGILHGVLPSPCLRYRAEASSSAVGPLPHLPAEGSL